MRPRHRPPGGTPPPATGLRRARLTDVLRPDAARPLALVSAPAGSGKTTLLTQVASTSGVPVAWFAATPDDGSAAAFTARLSGVLGHALGRDLPAGDLDALREALSRTAEDALLVLDDLHEIAGTEAEQQVQRLARRRPPGLRLLLGCRRAPLPDLPRLRLAADVTELTGEDLRFRTWEVERLFTEVYDEPLAPEAVAALTRRTGGWAAGIALFHLATSGRTAGQRQAAVHDLATGSRYLRSYLARTVLDGMPEGRRTFLVRTCALGVLTGPVCDELLGASGSLGVLEALAEEQVFTAPDDEGLSFRYHEVLQSHLEVALAEELGLVGARAWYVRAARLLEAAGRPQEALRAYARAEDWASLARILQREGPRGPGRASPGWWDLLPPGLHERDPWFALADARRRVRRGDLAGAHAGFARAEHLLDDPAFQHRCRHERALVGAWLPPTAGGEAPGPLEVLGHWSARVRAATVGAPQTWADRVPATPGAGDLLASGLGALLAGRPGPALRELRACAGAPVEEPGVHLAAQIGIAAAGALAGGAPVAGTPAPGRSPVDPLLEAVALEADGHDHPWLARVARGLQDLLGPGAGDPHLADRVRERERDGDPWGAALLQLLGSIGELRGDRGDAGLVDAAHRFAALGAPVLEAWARALVAASRARRGGADAASAAEVADRVARRARVGGTRAVVQGLLVGPAQPPPPARAGGAPTVRVECLGGFRLTVGGRPLDLEDVRPRARTLLRYLAARAGTDVHRERIVDDLWPDASLAAGVRSLQVAVSSLRRALAAAGLAGEQVLRRDGEAYGLHPPAGAAVDVLELRSLVRGARSARVRGDLAGAAAAGRGVLALHAGELLPEDGPAEWVLPLREELRSCAASAAAELGADCRALGLTAEAVAAVQRSLELDPWHDGSWRLLAALHDDLGDVVEAALTRQRHAALLQELGPAPPLVG